MKNLFLAAALMGAALSSTACTSTGAKVLETAQATCGRDYDGTITAGLTGTQFTGKVAIHCPVPGAAVGAVVVPAQAPVAPVG